MISYLVTATLAVAVMAATPKAPQWEHSYGIALVATRAGQDPLLVVLDNPNDNDARIEPAMLSEDDPNGDNSKLLAAYHLCHVDVTTKYGKKVATAFHATTFPFVAIIDKTGSVIIFKKAGQIELEEWKQTLIDHRTGERPTATAVSHVVLKPTGESSGQPYCPNCQRNHF
jgi:hypothetical protein